VLIFLIMYIDLSNDYPGFHCKITITNIFILRMYNIILNTLFEKRLEKACLAARPCM